MGNTTKLFAEQFSDHLLTLFAAIKEIIIVGDFNLHVNKTNSVDEVMLRDITDIFDLKQHISAPTHKCGNCLNLVSTSRTSNPEINKVEVLDYISNHTLVVGMTSFTT